jgi:hypothetical protein
LAGIILNVSSTREKKRGTMSNRHVLLGVAFALVSVVPMFGTGPSFIPDGTLKGSTLAGWHTMGPAKWHVENGELTGTPGPSGAGGWLVLDHPYQDIGLFTKFRCTDGNANRASVQSESASSPASYRRI